ncbi:MAG: sce7725 family protein [Mitsuaria chitosanitabida]|uniref:sce7725 family protein n=1 Tax=Roseateles chitosanitabidus TaxID=65048 RepID=UPI001B26E5F6|nr:sce7725 family protein [Roseateles chitosanitabidus]MBO9685872.1 sce7725 family protein [Roseateles chitosanitabidus]
MYHPYLHGKQKEVLALRHLASLLGAEAVVQPVIEPMRQAATSLRHTLEACEAHRLQVWLVINPMRQDFEPLRPAQAMEWGRHFYGSLPARQWIHPVLMLGPALTPDAVRRFAHVFGTRPVGLVVGHDAPPLHDVMALLGGVDVRRVFFRDAEPAPQARAAAGPAGCVWVEDRRLPEAADLRQRDRHPFSDRHLRYRAEGFAGFSDYTTLPSRPDAPDPTPRAECFRMSFIHHDKLAGDSIWTEHFTGPRGAEDLGAGGRFRQALQGFRESLDRPDASFGPTEAVRRYLGSMITTTPPSRALSKQWEVMHHLELVSGLLTGRFAGAFPARVPEDLLGRTASPPPGLSVSEAPRPALGSPRSGGRESR